MQGPYFSWNGELRPMAEAQISLEDIHYAYGYGVYETLKVRKGRVYFPHLHEQRLYHSAGILGLEHPWGPGFLVEALNALVQADHLQDANLKVLLIGGYSAAEARLAILPLNPLFPDRKLYRDGATAVTESAERAYPQAKSLNMLTSTLAFRRAGARGAYDALLVNRRGEITEGTRTNFFVTQGGKILTPPAEDVLTGVTQLTFLHCMDLEGIPVERRALALKDWTTWDGAFLTSTSTKVMPLRELDAQALPLDPLIRRVLLAYDAYLDRVQGDDGEILQALASGRGKAWGLGE